MKDSSVTTENQKVDSPDPNYYEDIKGDGNGISEFSRIPTKNILNRQKELPAAKAYNRSNH